MDKKLVAWLFIIAGVIATFFPQLQGVLVGSTEISIGDSRIIGMIALVGGALLYFMPSDKE